MLNKLRQDLQTNNYRYNFLLVLFFLVYFGEVLVASRLLHQLSSVERQFWGWWFLATVFQALPLNLSFILVIILVLGLFIALVLGLYVAADLALWSFYLLITIFIASLVSAWRSK